MEAARGRVANLYAQLEELEPGKGYREKGEEWKARLAN
jgi:hypothetical protein